MKQVLPGNRRLLMLAAIVTVVVWQLPFGHQILYPFTLLATYAHEMGHGLTALLLGGDLHGLELFWNGSGLARWSGSVGRIGRAMVSAGGLIGPSLAGALLLVVSRKPLQARAILVALGVLVALTVIFAGNLFAIVFILTVAATFIGVARWTPGFAPFFVQLVGVQLCLAVFRDVSYMFSPGANVGGVLRPSDSSQIADALFLPYWFWGGLVAIGSFAVLAAGMYFALRPPPRA